MSYVVRRLRSCGKFSYATRNVMIASYVAATSVRKFAASLRRGNCSLDQMWLQANPCGVRVQNHISIASCRMLKDAELGMDAASVATRSYRVESTLATCPVGIMVSVHHAAFLFESLSLVPADLNLRLPLFGAARCRHCAGGHAQRFVIVGMPVQIAAITVIVHLASSLSKLTVLEGMERAALSHATLAGRGSNAIGHVEDHFFVVFMLVESLVTVTTHKNVSRQRPTHVHSHADYRVTSVSIVA